MTTIKLTEKDLNRIIKRVIVETSPKGISLTYDDVVKACLGYLIEWSKGMRPFTDRQGITGTVVKNDEMVSELKKYLISLRDKKEKRPLSKEANVLLRTIIRMLKKVHDKQKYITLGSTYNESVLSKNIGKMLSEQKTQRYMFFSNLEQMRRQCDLLLDLDHSEIESILSDGHDWAQDHIAEAKNNMDQVFDFLMNETKRYHKMGDEVMVPSNTDVMEEGRKKTGTKLCARGKAAAKARYDVFPSAYSNGHGVQVCKGKIKGLDGKKRCSPPYC